MSKIPIYSAQEQTSRCRAGAVAFMGALLALGMAAVVTAAPAAAQDKKPNIV